MNDYEKKYKEALNKAKDMLLNKEVRQEDMEYLFPELKESEDERIKNWIRKELESKYVVNNLVNNVMADKALAWLEKQGMQPRYNIGDVICDKSCTTLNKEAQPNMEIVDIQNGMYICDKGSFPVSQQDEYELVGKKIDSKLNDDSVSNELREASTKHAENELKNQTFHDNLEFELIYKKPTAWSEEDEEILRTIISDGIRGAEFDMLQIDWLKSIKNRYAWKPSDEQMKVLEAMLTVSPQSPTMTSTLIELYEDLNKLRGE